MRKIFSLFLLFQLSSYAQQPTDCVNSIISCGNSDINFNSNGAGIQEVTGNNSCGSGESNSVWIKVTIDTPGTLGFTLTPSSTNLNVDYDFFVFGPNAVCGNLGQTIRCSTTNPINAGLNYNTTGMRDTPDNGTFEGPGDDGDSFVEWMNVLNGEVYYFVIDRPIGNSPFNLTWTGSATFEDAPTNELPIGHDTSFSECDGDGDGVATFDLTGFEAGMVGLQNVTVTYYENLGDAQLGNNSIPNPTLVVFDSANQIIYVRLTDNNSACWSVFEIELKVLDFLTLTANDFLLCDNGADDVETFNLTTQDAQITTGISNAIVTYHILENDASNGTAPLTNTMASAFQNTSNPQIIWVRVVDLDTGCSGYTSFELHALAIPIANPVQDWTACDDDNDGIFTFDLSTLDTQVLDTQNPADYTITYHQSSADANLNNAPYPTNYTNITPYTAEPVYVRIENNLNTDCYDFSTIPFFLDVIDDTVITDPAPCEICDDLSDGNETNGITTFNLSTIDAEVLGIQPSTDFNVNYYLSQADADLGDSTIALSTSYENTTAHSQIIYVRIENSGFPDCYKTALLTLTVHPVPVINYNVDFYQCDDDQDGIAPINLEEINSIISTDASNTFTYFRTAAQANNGTPIIPNFGNFSNAIASTVFCRVESQFGCFRVAQVDLHVTASQMPTDFHLDYHVCDDANDGDDTNGVATFNFSDAIPLIKNLFPATQNMWVTFFENELDALLENNEIDPTNHGNINSPNIQQLYIRVDNADNNACIGLGEFITLVVNPLPEFTVDTPVQVCIGETFTLNAYIDNSLNEYDFLWSNAERTLGNQQTLDITQAGEYFIKISFKDTDCSTSESILVTESQRPTITNYIIKDFNNPENSLIVEILGIGDYEYMLNHLVFYTFEDDREWQDTPIFNNLQAGAYEITVRDKNSCGEIQEKINILDYPKFLTPNNDDAYDTWRVYGQEFLDHPEKAVTYIYDRFGKVIAKLDAYKKWNGFYLGHILPQTDYWFSIEYTNNQGKEIVQRGHISLILR